MMTTQFNTLENSLYTLIDKLKRQRKWTDKDSIYDNLIKSATFQNLSKDVLQDKIADLVIEGKIINKINRCKNSYWINEEIMDTAVEITVNLLHNFTLDTPNISPSSSPLHYDNSSSIIPLPLEIPATTNTKQTKWKHQRHR